MGEVSATAGSQYRMISAVVREERLGLMSGYSWRVDPKRLGFTASRYKFVGRMLEGRRSVLEVGCADGFFSRIVRQFVGGLVCVDRDYGAIGSAKGLQRGHDPVADGFKDIVFNQWDLLEEGPLGGFDGVYCLDVLEHVERSDKFLRNLAGCAPVAIVGMPSLESQAYASNISKLEHVNCMTKGGLRTAMGAHFEQVFMFGMNDEVLHTGMDEMTSYLFAVGVNAAKT